MPNGKPACSEEEFMRLFDELGPTQTAKRLGISERSVFARRSRLQLRYGQPITGPRPPPVPLPDFSYDPYPDTIYDEIGSGVVVVFSDCHYWPTEPSLMHRAVVHLCRELKPVRVIANGDIIDGATISRFPRSGWEPRPSVAQELEVAKERMGEIEIAAGKARKLISRGNHDSRFEGYLARNAPEICAVQGVGLGDHFGAWECAISIQINDDTIVKHRARGGMYGPKNSTLYSGMNMILGDRHSSIVHPFTDRRNGTRWGVDTGMIAEPWGPQFKYMEANTRDWREGFAILTWKAGRLLSPELVYRWDGDHVQFRGEVIKV